MISLSKGQCISLKKEAGDSLSRVTLGLGWDAIEKKTRTYLEVCRNEDIVHSCETLDWTNFDTLSTVYDCGDSDSNSSHGSQVDAPQRGSVAAFLHKISGMRRKGRKEERLRVQTAEYILLREFLVLRGYCSIYDEFRKHLLSLQDQDEYAYSPVDLGEVR